MPLDRLWRGIERLSPRARARLALENDDRVFSVADLAPVCGATGVPLVYDVHHHRCHPDGLTVEQATELAVDT
jgi:UV DNA damage endonuclease